MKQVWMASLTMLALAAMPERAAAHEYDRGDSDHPLRYVAYALHPIGWTAEMVVLRPFHRFVHKPTAGEVMGHDLDHSHPGDSYMRDTAMNESWSVEAAEAEPAPMSPPPPPAPIQEYQDEEETTHLEVLSELLFESGTATLTDGGKEILGQVLARIHSFPAGRPVMFEGHTDNDPIVHSEWNSNWDLGAARSIRVLEYLVSQGLDPARCGATTYSEYRPRASNDTPEGKLQNRRVHILIMAEGAGQPGDPQVTGAVSHARIVRACQVDFEIHRPRARGNLAARFVLMQGMRLPVGVWGWVVRADAGWINESTANRSKRWRGVGCGSAGPSPLRCWAG